MRSQPAGEGDLRAVGQEVHHTVSLQIQQQGSVADSASEGEIVDTENFDCFWRRQNGLADGSQQRVTARSHLPMSHLT
jgi:hypothetical protein